MRITALTATILSIPRRVTLATAYGTRDDATTVLVVLDTDAGVTGYGQAPVDPPAFGAAGIRANILAHLAPVVVGQSPLEITRLVEVLERALPGQPLAQAAVELALWDLAGKALGVPVYQLLGGKVRDGITLMAMVHEAEPDALYAETQATLALPYPVLKLKIGMGTASDLARYRAVREAAGGARDYSGGRQRGLYASGRASGPCGDGAHGRPRHDRAARGAAGRTRCARRPLRRAGHGG